MSSKTINNSQWKIETINRPTIGWRDGCMDDRMNGCTVSDYSQSYPAGCHLGACCTQIARRPPGHPPRVSHRVCPPKKTVTSRFENMGSLPLLPSPPHAEHLMGSPLVGGPVGRPRLPLQLLFGPTHVSQNRAKPDRTNIGLSSTISMACRKCCYY